MTIAIDNLTAVIKATEAIEDTAASILEAAEASNDATIQALADELKAHTDALSARIEALKGSAATA